MTNTATIVIVVVLIVALIGFRIWRSVREQRWKVPGMWILPAVFAVLFGAIIWFDVAASVWVIPAAIGGAVVGLGIGLYQGTHTTVRVDLATHSAYIKISPIGNLIFFSVLALRIGLRFVLAPPSAVQHAAESGAAIPTIPADAAIISSALLALAIGMILGLRLYVQRRYSEAASRA